MLQPLTETELLFMEHWSDPTSLTENLIPENHNAPQTWSKDCKCIWLRFYQVVMQNFSYMYADDDQKSYEENFQEKKGAGDCYQIGARDLGKSFFLKIDFFLSVIKNFREVCVSSFDELHLKNVTQPLSLYFESHPFFKIFQLKDSRKTSVSRSPFNAITEHGTVAYGVNEKVDSPEPGTQYHAKHFETLFFEEFSYASPSGTEKRIDSGASYGHIERFSGIPDLRIGSPATKILANLKKKNWTWRMPQYIREDWSEEIRNKKIEEYNGESSAGFRLNVLAEKMEGVSGFWDMARLKEKSLKLKNRVKYFEVNKDTFNDFERIIHIEKLPGAIVTFLNADIGAGASPTEITIVFYDGKKYKYIYNIALYKLVQKEQAVVIKWLYDVLGGCFIAYDNTGDHGGISTYLKDMGIPVDHITEVNFNENIEVDFEKDVDGKIITDNGGVPIMKSVRTIDWAMSELEKLMYSGDFEVPLDEKFLTQFNAYWVRLVGTRRVYGSSIDDHEHQSFQCGAINIFFQKFNQIRNQNINQEVCYFVPNTRNK